MVTRLVADNSCTVSQHVIDVAAPLPVTTAMVAYRTIVAYSNDLPAMAMVAPLHAVATTVSSLPTIVIVA